jgi:hypothetical protein
MGSFNSLLLKNNRARKAQLCKLFDIVQIQDSPGGLGGATIGRTIYVSPILADRRDLKLCRMLHYHLVDVHIVRTGGSNHFSLSYDGYKRGAGCKIA